MNLRVLILEDRPEDAELMLRELRRAGYNPEFQRVASEAEFAASLSEGWDIILSDYFLPAFTGLQAMRLMQERGLDIPFVLATGSTNEEIAAECMRAGAADYVLKDHLARLGPAVQRALERKRARDERRQALEALRESEAKLRTVFHSSADLITIADMETGAYVEVNDGFLQATGYTRDEVLGKTGDDLRLWVDPDQRARVVSRLVQGMPAHNEETWFRKKDGTPFVGLLTAEIVTVSGRPSLLCVVRDITERKQMERQSEERRLFLESVLACAPDAVAVLDAQARVVEWSLGAEALFGYTRDEALGRDIDELVAAPDPAIRREAVGMTQRLLRGEPVKTTEMVRYHKDGSPVTVIAAGAPIVMEGRVVGIVAVYTDITERKRAEDALRDSEQRYQTLAEISPVGIFRTDAQGKTTYVNPRWSEISGLDAQNALANGWLKVVHPEDRDHIAAGWADATKASAPSTAEYRFLRPDGQVAWVMGQAIPETDAQGNVVGYVGTITDITERKRMEEALARRNRELQTLNELSRALAQTLDLQRIYVTARDYVAQLVDAPVFGISLYDAASRTLRAEFMSSDGEILDTAQFPPLAMPSDAPEPLRGRAKVILTAEPEVIASLPDVLAQTGAKSRVIGAAGDEREPLSAAYVPMVVEGQVIGLMEVQSYRAHAYDKDAADVLRSVAGQIGLAIQNARLFQQVQAHAAELERSLEELQRTQYALIASEARFRSLVESMDDIVFTLDRQGRHTGVFGRWLEKYGTPAEMYLGKAAREVLGPEAARVHEEANARALAGDNVVYEWSAERPDGTIYVQTSLSPLRGPNGQVVGIVGVGRDITNLKRMEQALRESETRYRVLLDFAPVAIAVHQDRKIVFTNPAGARLLGAESPAQIVGKPISEIVHPERLAAAEDRIRRMLAGEKGLYPVEDVYVRLDGTPVAVEVMATPLVYEGKPAVQVIVTDITERKHMEQALRESEQRYRSLVNLSPDGIWVHRYGEVLFANRAAAAMFGAQSPDDLIGKQTLDFVAPEYQEVARERMRRGQEEREPAPLMEERLLRLDGSEFWADVCAVPIEWGGQPAVQVIIRDITERKQMEERLLQAQKMEVVGRLAGGVAHDFNNILTAITGYATFALEALPPSDPVCQDIQQVLDSAQRAANLTRQLLAFSRRQVMEQRVISLNDLIMNLDKMLRRLIGEDVELITLPGENLAAVRADAGQIEQVIVNLAVNARDAMPDGGKLIIETANVTLDEDYARRHPGAEPGDYVLLAITDTGVGMTDEVKAHLFEPFFTTKGPGKGTGLGLATVYGIVKQHGGNIYAYSEPGKGTTFKVYLPAVRAEVERLPRRDDEGFIPGGTETVLVVEDEPLVRSMIVRTLREQGYRILEAANGNEALRLAEEYEGEIHLLLTDVVMPQMGGKELQERLAALRPGIRALFVSGYTDNAIAHRGILDPGVTFLQKPFTSAALARKVRQVLDRG